MNASAKSEMVVKEGVEGYFRYHLAREDQYKSLCGCNVMNTSIPLSAWGTKTHLNEKWCKLCANQNALGQRERTS